ncbi:MAG: matrixin family metalloprotease [Phycisphaeraceae bacterium]|nr:matrixin family metalloprotease [Phycisphaeraceae bacterium]
MRMQCLLLAVIAPFAVASTVANAGSGSGELSELHREMLSKRSDAALSTCFAEGASPELVAAFAPADAARFQNAGRWERAAYAPAGSPFGQPVTISYSIVPDGTPINGFNGEADAPSNLREFLTGIHGSEAAWMAHVHAAFARWSEVCGVKYVFEENDDGVALGYGLGVPGVRGDCRIGGHRIDTNGNILAYAFFPSSFEIGESGDVVVDTSDNFFNNLAGNSLLLRNVIAHEHGHGLGMAHACPVDASKLMEPFIASNFDGPRHDEVRHGQYLYGDRFEPNDDAGAATAMGELSACGALRVGDRTTISPFNPAELNRIPQTSPAALGYFGDRDFYSFETTAALRVDVKLEPVGYLFDDSPEACGGCCSGTLGDSQRQWRLGFDVLAADGQTVIGSETATTLGGAALASEVLLPSAGNYFVRVRGDAFEAGSQMYSLVIDARSAALRASPAGETDQGVLPGASRAIDIVVAPDREEVDVSSSRLWYRRTPAEAWRAALLRQESPGLLRGIIFNVPCGVPLEWYAEVAGTGGTVVTTPCGAPAATHKPFVGARTVVFEDDFEVGRGWSVGTDTATSGNWTRTIPVGTQAQPGEDRSPVGSRCYVTGNGLPGDAPGAADVDGGYTQVVSPLLNLAVYSDVEVSYWRWYSNGSSSGPYVDTASFDVNVNNTSNFFWRKADIIGPGSAIDTDVNGGWRKRAFRFSSLPVTPTSMTRLRFYVSDLFEGSIVEAALDDVKVVGLRCDAVPSCIGDLNGNKVVGDADFGLFVEAYNQMLCPAENQTCPADFDLNGFVDDADFSIFVGAYASMVCS